MTKLQAQQSRRQEATAALSREVLPVSPLELGMALTLFRRAALDEESPIDDPFRPLSDCYAEASLAEDGYARGMTLLSIHYNQPDTATPTMRRITAFVQLLRAKALSPDQDWIHFSAAYDRFTPILYSIAWCPLLASEPFEALQFMRLAKAAPLRIEESMELHKIN